MAVRELKGEHPGFDPKDTVLRLDRYGRVVLFRLRTGHNKMKAHMYS